MRARRLAFTGAQGVGKSTVVRELGRLLAERGSVQLVDGIGADAARLGVPLGAAADANTLCAFAALHLHRERGPINSDIALFDRCLLDLVAYSAVTGCARSLLGLLREVASWSLARFDRIYYLPIEDFSRRSRVDRENDQFRLKVDAQIVDEAAALGLELSVLSGTIKERTNRVMADLFP